MSHVSLVASSYPYRSTLLRLDANGDGMLSREEIAADQRPGILSTSVDSQSSDASNSALGSLVAKLMQLPTDGKTDVKGTQLMQPETDAATDSQTTTDLYRGTYGQYDLDDMAA